MHRKIKEYLTEDHGISSSTNHLICTVLVMPLPPIPSRSHSHNNTCAYYTLTFPFSFSHAPSFSCFLPRPDINIIIIWDYLHTHIQTKLYPRPRAGLARLSEWIKFNCTTWHGVMDQLGLSWLDTSKKKRLKFIFILLCFKNINYNKINWY